MNKEEKEAIEIVKEIRKSDLMSAEFDIEELYNAIQTTLNLIDKLQKENKKYIDIFNSTEKIMNGQERTKDKLLNSVVSPVLRSIIQ